jgi:putative NIF3 family GTP cyclohydrolase 1 type 2
MRALLAAGMNLYVMHTNYDHAPQGVNDALADLLGLRDRVPMSLGCIGTCTLSVGEIA